MKRLSLFLLTFVYFNSFAQTVLTYDSVLVFDGKPKDKLFSLSKQFLAQAFNDSKEVIQLDDKENGIIIGKGNFSYQFSTPRMTCTRGNGKGIVDFTLKIQVKDGKIKMTMSDLKHTSTDPNINIGLVYKNQSYPDGSPIDKCRVDVYKDILSQSLVIYNDLLAKLKGEFQKEIKTEDW